MDRRTRNAEIFEDTEKMYRADPDLKQSIQISIDKQIFIPQSTVLGIPTPNKKQPAHIVVSGARSLEAAEYYAREGKKVCVLNFASATNPGGGVISGSSAQEECICRCTTLFPCLNANVMWDLFYTPHRQANDPLYNDDCIYTPDVTVFKKDIDFPSLLPITEWYKVDIISCAAPNLRSKPSNAMNPHAGDTAANISNDELRGILSSRIRRIFELATCGGADVLVLGAFGCGAFRNPPELVAEVFNDVMTDFLYCFDTIEYAVYHTEREIANFDAFHSIIVGKYQQAPEH